MWSTGDVIVQRQVWHERVVFGIASIVIEANARHLVTYVPPGAHFGSIAGAYPGPGGNHPWHGRDGWVGHGMLQITPPGSWVSVQHFWGGPAREFVCWYLNIQEPMRPTSIGFDTQDLELDIVVAPDGTWSLKDDELLDQRVAEGRWSDSEAAAIRAIGRDTVAHVLDTGDWWWDREWADWVPPATQSPVLPDGWDQTPVPSFEGFPPRA